MVTPFLVIRRYSSVEDKGSPGEEGDVCGAITGTAEEESKSHLTRRFHAREGEEEKKKSK